MSIPIQSPLKNRKKLATKLNRIQSRNQRRKQTPQKSGKVEVGFRRAIEKWLDVFLVDILKELSPLLRSFDTEAETLNPVNTRTDAIFFPPEFKKRLNILELKLGQRIDGPELEALIRRWGKLQQASTVKSVNRVLGLSFTPEVEGLFEQFIVHNTNLIKSIAGKALQQAELEISKAGNVGLRHEVLRENLIKKLGISRKKASLIARDQMLKLNGQIARETHKQAGIEEYIWTSSGDDDVRETHEELDGQKFSYNKGPELTGGLHPGEEINCRCTAYPVVPFLDPDRPERNPLAFPPGV